MHTLVRSTVISAAATKRRASEDLRVAEFKGCDETSEPVGFATCKLCGVGDQTRMQRAEHGLTGLCSWPGTAGTISILWWPPCLQHCLLNSRLIDPASAPGRPHLCLPTVAPGAVRRHWLNEGLHRGSILQQQPGSAASASLCAGGSSGGAAAATRSFGSPRLPAAVTGAAARSATGGLTA